MAALIAAAALTQRPLWAESPLVVEHSVTVGGMTSDRFTWQDAANQARAAVLAHNTGQVGPGGTRGGELRELRYQTPGGERVVRASESFASGFGYVVSHRSEGGAGLGTDDSPLGHGFTGQFQRVFEGRHHAIFRFTQLYPRFSRTDAAPPNTQYNVPVTVEWMFATGRDHPLWSITWDLSGVPADAVDSDSRAPYGELLFDGAGSEGAHAQIAGVGWGDRYKFLSTTDPVTYNSAWTWNTANTVPYVKLWTTGVDATMGTVQTQTILQQDAGGYFGTERWNTTSAAGNACDVGPAHPFHDGTHLMPCDFNWPYQSINYSMGAANGGNDNVGTNNTRLAWGTNFGFLGQTSYATQGSAFWGGPLPDTFASGWPRKSYSTFVVLGRHSDDPVGAEVAEIETVQTTALTAAVGTVRTSGPAGVNRADTTAYAPAGWNHVYAAWALSASSNGLDANFNVGAGTLANPVVIVSNWTAQAVPDTVRLNGMTLVPDVDYFLSVRADASELWLTLNRDVSGATNRLEVSPPSGDNGSGGRPQPVWHPFFAVNTLETPYVGDFDGDGKTDIITFTRQNPLAFGDVYVALSNGVAFGPNNKWHDFFAINTSESVVIGDYNGDGKDDIATWLGNTSRQVYVALSFGTGMAQETVWVDSIGFDPTDVLAAGDVNADGRADLVMFARKQGKVYVALSDGTKFGTPTLWHSFFAVSTYERPRVGDVNGDGRADILTFATDSPTAFGDVYTAISDGTKFGDGQNSDKWHDFFSIRPTEEIRIGDLNGDGKDDFFTFLPPPFAQCYTSLSQGTQLGPSVLWPEAVAPSATDRPFVGDVNGDGKADIIIFAQGEGRVYVSLAP